MKRLGSVLAILPLAGLGAFGLAGCAHHGYATYDDQHQYQEQRPSYAEPRQGYQERGGRRETLRSLAQELDQSVQELGQAQSYGRRERDERKLRDGVEELMKKNARFQERLERRGSRSDLREDVSDMREIASKLGDRLRDTRVSREAWSSFGRVQEILGRMDQVLSERRGRDRDDD